MDKFSGNDVEIIQTKPSEIRIKVDGVELKWVTDFEYNSRVDRFPEMTVTFIPSTVNFK